MQHTGLLTPGRLQQLRLQLQPTSKRNIILPVLFGLPGKLVQADTIVCCRRKLRECVLSLVSNQVVEPIGELVVVRWGGSQRP